MALGGIRSHSLQARSLVPLVKTILMHVSQKNNIKIVRKISRKESSYVDFGVKLTSSVKISGPRCLKQAPSYSTLKFDLASRRQGSSSCPSRKGYFSLRLHERSFLQDLENGGKFERRLYEILMSKV
ncbi:hypothetical protein V1477_007519 [Vespula maculifrons]|uniref:Uncharacterized protein n=1 Tax=Vespula maculifrons TaxID=7453 RepID=A0ABD2CIS9_VESMC